MNNINMAITTDDGRKAKDVCTNNKIIEFLTDYEKSFERRDAIPTSDS